MKKTLLSILLLGIIIYYANGQSCHLEMPVSINPDSNIKACYTITQDIMIDDLSDPNQWITSVDIHFTHSIVSDMLVYLETPGGQEILLIGPRTPPPNGRTTTGTEWDVSFISSEQTAMQDAGFQPWWQNNNNWSNFFGRYTGSYYPFDDQVNLEDLNVGTITGEWCLRIETQSLGPGFSQGRIFDFRVHFNNEAGLDCCLADAGNFNSSNDVLSCVNDPQLNIGAPRPRYTGNVPDETLYNLNYIIASGEDIVAVVDSVDLTNEPEGDYTVCSFSYDNTVDISGVTARDLTELRDNLDSFTPDFCGDISSACMQVRVVNTPAPEDSLATICFGESFILGDSTFTETGRHTFVFESYAGCDSVVNVDLTVLDIAPTNISETICEGDSSILGSEVYKTTGIYTTTLKSINNCDSIIQLDLTVLTPQIVNIDTVICPGTSFNVGSKVYAASGDYRDTLSSRVTGCDSIVVLDLQILELQALVESPDWLTCKTPIVTLDGSRSSSGGGILYEWTTADGNLIGNVNQTTAQIDQPGTYTLGVRLDNANCPDPIFKTVSVRQDTSFFETTAIANDTQLDCNTNTIQIEASVTYDPLMSYRWEAVNNTILDSVLNPIATEPDTYYFISTHLLTACEDTSTIVVNMDTIAPIADAGIDENLDCRVENLRLDGRNSTSGLNYSWTTSDGNIVSGMNSRRPTINAAGTYQIRVENPNNACTATDEVTISPDLNTPTVEIAEPTVLNCATTAVVLDASNSSEGANYTFSWQVISGNILPTTETSLEPTVDAAGVYRLHIEDTNNGCRDSSTVVVTEERSVVIANTGSNQTITCDNPTIELDASGSTGDNLAYNWTSTEGHFVNNTQAIATIDSGGVYQLIVTNTADFCSDTATIEVRTNNEPPVAQAIDDLQIDWSNHRRYFDEYGV